VPVALGGLALEDPGRELYGSSEVTPNLVSRKRRTAALTTEAQKISFKPN
jgi:hypothetical protein